MSKGASEGREEASEVEEKEEGGLTGNTVKRKNVG